MDHKWKFPPCFNTGADYALWRDGPYQENLAAQHCADCLPSFKMRMAKAGRCEHPETVFAFTPSHFDGEDGVEISGHWKREPTPQIVRFIKPERRGRPKKIKPAPDPKQEESYWQKQERLMRERMNLGR